MNEPVATRIPVMVDTTSLFSADQLFGKHKTKRVDIDTTIHVQPRDFERRFVLAVAIISTPSPRMLSSVCARVTRTATAANRMSVRHMGVVVEMTLKKFKLFETRKGSNLRTARERNPHEKKVSMVLDIDFHESEKN